MRRYKDSNNNLYVYFDNAFDDEGNVINKKVKSDIETLSLIEITEEEEKKIKTEQQENTEKEASTQEELAKAEKLITLYEQLAELGVI